MKFEMITEYNWAFGFDHCLETLMSGPVLVGTWWYDGMFYPNSAGFVTPSGSRAGGHEYLLVGADPTKRTLTFQNSWSDLWGVKGRFYMTFDNFKRLLAEDGDAVLPRRR
jgi:C1A family cysteine protease